MPLPKPSSRRMRLCSTNARQAVTAEKQQIIRKSGLLEFGNTEQMENVGGLDVLKEWLAQTGACLRR